MSKSPAKAFPNVRVHISSNTSECVRVVTHVVFVPVEGVPFATAVDTHLVNAVTERPIGNKCFKHCDFEARSGRFQQRKPSLKPRLQFLIIPRENKETAVVVGCTSLSCQRTNLQ